MADLDATILAAAGLERLAIRIQPDGELDGDGSPSGFPGRGAQCRDHAALRGAGGARHRSPDE